MSDSNLVKIPKQISSTLNSVNKTISNNKNLKLNINSNIILEKEETLNLPSISSSFDFNDLRGASDSFALKKRFHNEGLLNQLVSINPDIKEEITFLEKMRYELYGSKPYKGIAKNIHTKWLKRLNLIQAKNQSDIRDLLFFTLTKYFIDISDSKEWKRSNELLKKITNKENNQEFYNLLTGLPDYLDNQKKFLEHSLNLLRLISIC